MKKSVRKLLSYMHDKAFIKHILSYMSILSIAIFLFFLIYNQYFLSIYSKEVITQKKNALERLAADLERQVCEFSSIAGQLSKQNVMQDKYIVKTPASYINIQKTLSGIASTHSSFSQIAFYSTGSPNTLYTNKGSYNISYFKHFRTPGGNWQNIKYMLPSIKSPTWLLPQDFHWQTYNTESLTLDYIIPVPNMDGSFVIFSIPSSILDSLIYSQDVQTIVFDKNYTQLYPFSPLRDIDLDKIQACLEQDIEDPVEVEGKAYMLCTLSGKNEFILVQIIPHHIMYHNIINVQKIFMLGFLSLFIIGSILVYIMSTLNYKPILRLNNLISEKGLDIPDNLYGTDIASFAIQQLDCQYKTLECNRLREKILLSLIHKKIGNATIFEEQFKRANLNFTSPIIRVALFFINPINILEKNKDIVDFVNAMLSDTYEVNGIEYLENNCYLFTIGYEQENQHRLSKRLSQIALQLTAHTNNNIRITVGSACKATEQLSISYMQAMWVSKNSTLKDRVIFYDNNLTPSVPFVYPKIDIEALNNAILNGSTDKIHILTDTLVDRIKENLHNNFISISLCFDIINTYLYAIDKLNISTSNITDTYNHYFNLYEVTDIKSLIDMIYKLKQDALRILSENSQAINSNHVIAQIIGYINNNYQYEYLCASYIADKFNMSVSNLSHQFKAQTGLNISDFITEKRIMFSKELLKDSKLTINDIATRLGYSQASSFIRKFKQYVKCTPNEYRLIYQKNQQ